ncbi:MAG: hypothetical protein ABSE82_01085 [Nitrososphaerales archaeon]
MTAVADSKFESFLSELASKCNLKKEKLAELIQQKRASVGDGYLTDQGALFLVAADLGVEIEYDQGKPSSLARLSKDQSSVTITSRILSVGYPKTFTRKSDSRKGLLSRLIIYDNSTSTSLSLWDQSVISFLGTDIRPGDLVKISNAYTKPALDGSPSLNLGEKSLIEKITNEKDLGSTKSLAERTLPLAKIPENDKSLVVQGRVEGEVKKTAFTRSDGTPSDLASFTMNDLKNPEVKHRVVIWGNSNPVFSLLKDSETVTLLNVRTKLSNYQNSMSIEIHGDETTCILEHWEETKSWMKDLTKNSEAIVKSVDQSGKNPSGILPFISRILSIRQSDAEARSYLLVVDSQKRKISVTASGVAVRDTAVLNTDDLVLCKPESLDNGTLRATTSKEKTILKLGTKRPDIPLASSLVSMVEKLGEDGVVSLEIMSLTDSLGREIQTKDGLVKRTELTVADHTGEIKVYGWRNLSKLVENYSAGDRILLGAVEVQTHEGKKFLVLKNYSTVRKLES